MAHYLSSRADGESGHDTVLSVPVATVRPMTTSTGVARLQVVALDCPDPSALTAFYAAVLGTTVERTDADWVQLAPTGGTPLAFQRVADYRPPEWPGAEHPQQLHLDLEVDDLDAGEAAVVALGARTHEVQPGETFRVFLDPAGHPFCLVLP